MEEKPLDLGSLSYINDHIGFYGTMKNSPDDFVVTEIDVNGQLVTKVYKEVNEELQTQQSNDRNIKKPKLCPGAVEIKDTLDGDICEALVAKTGHVFEDQDVPECEEDQYNVLNTLLCLDVVESLTNFACSVRSAFESKVTGGEQRELSLGLFPEKNSRAGLHGAVRQTFPFLLTFTRSTELLVKPNLDYQELSLLTSEEEADKFFTFLDAKVENSRFTFQPDVCKEHRTSVHHFISKKFGKLVETKSFSEKCNDGQQKVCITVRFRERRGSSGKRPRSEETPDIFTAFTLEKKNLETLEAIGYLASALGVLPSDFSYAGIKDKKAITYQSVVVKKVTPERLRGAEGLLEKKGLKIYNIHPTNQHLHLGQLSGNHFSMVVRDVRCHTGDPSEDLERRVYEAAHKIKNRGFINYYGPQRFGKGQNVQSHKIGLALLKGEMALAIKLFFTPEEGDDPVNKAKQYFYQTGDIKGTLPLMPAYKVRERMLLRALNRYGMSDEGCIRGWLSIPHSMRIFYIHAYCSKVWNEAASYRIATFGSRVVEGDLVLHNHNAIEITSLSDRVHIVTAAEEEVEAYSMHQVVLPMPGHSIKYPTNQVGEWYKEALASAGLQSCKFRVGTLQLNIPGCYRHIIKYPHHLIYELVVEIDKQSQETDSKHTKKITLKLSFQLDSSCYATVCLREMMKCNF
ncbi:pseudouridylate synthase 7 homolog-like protein isoform X1 [Bufo bufo]|uniref:pseudouridylate synthase 7 homolog-like protein isoform X1 n=1 Tax=Bufo bufo TaxID=8384 RepID=UPI001ABE87A8|nr:pseudouridylate synthase 7 homolog-like protein isoform X1 [Bufo bufo]XP_040266671.1 pseudouridylate synthase 7 homolog-like protein isoform X1 [Bufo bufo]XP_040266678.1 pseudouridylate synthase 7 homolog-like protein isoform X1 [Bufo bufo]